MTSIDFQTVMIAVIVSMSCGLLGVFLVLRKMSMMIDAISHTVLLGIVVAYMIFRDIESPWIMVGATIVGVLTVVLIEGLVNTKRVSEDAATGTIFPLLFAIAVIMITTMFRNTHLDQHAINGNLEFAAYEQLTLFGIEIGSKAMYINLGVLLVIIAFIILFFKELKIITFDKALAISLGISPIFIHYGLMTMVSMTAVTSFNAVGAILVIAMMIGPAATSILISKDLKIALLNSVIFAVVNSLLGYVIAMYVFNGDVNIASTMASVTLVTFLTVWTFEPKKGLITKLIRLSQQKKEFEFTAFIIHIGNHVNTNEASKELNINEIMNELHWKDEKVNKYINKGLDYGYLDIQENLLKLTITGAEFYKFKLASISREV